MLFQAPSLLYLMGLALAVLVAYAWAERRRRRFALRYPSVSLARAAARGRGWRRHFPPLLFVLCLSAALLALARPAIPVRVPSDEGIIIVSLDVSASMWANDMAPTRMEAAKAAAQLFVDQLPRQARIGVVSFSDRSFLHQAPTTDREAVRRAIGKLVPHSGTAIGYGILTSLDAIHGALGVEMPPVSRGVFAPAVIVLLTDGENTDGPPPLDIVDQPARSGVRIYTIGIGSPQGATTRQNGVLVQARLDQATLEQIAARTSGEYYNASTERDLRAVYQNLTTQIIVREEKQDIGFVFTAAAFVLGSSALLFSLLWNSRLP
jgi:Ca-activated chloride channel family protein